MKKMFFSITTIVFVVIAGFGVSKSMDNKPKSSQQVMDNIEALTDDEDQSKIGTLYSNKEGTYFCCKSGGYKGCGAKGC